MHGLRAARTWTKYFEPADHPQLVRFSTLARRPMYPVATFQTICHGPDRSAAIGLVHQR